MLFELFLPFSLTCAGGPVLSVAEAKALVSIVSLTGAGSTGAGFEVEPVVDLTFETFTVFSVCDMMLVSLFPLAFTTNKAAVTKQG